MPLITPQPGIRRLAHSVATVSVGASTNEEALATVTVPGGLLGPNGGLQIWTLWSYTNSANNKVCRVRAGGLAGTQFRAVVQTTTASLHDLCLIRNQNSQSVQVGWISASAGGVGAHANALVTAAIDTSADWDLVLTGQKANAGETLTLQAWEAFLLS